MISSLGCTLCSVLLLALHISGSAATCIATCQVEVNAASPAPDENVTGTVTLTQESASDDITIVVSLTGFNASDGVSNHGFHVHELNNLSNGCNSLAGHYNPHGYSHSAPSSAERHVGDLGNIQEDGSGDVSTTITDSVVSLFGDYSVLNRSFVVHALEDDLGLGGDAGSLATGNAGSRLSCCIITESSGDCSSGVTRLHYDVIMMSLSVIFCVFFVVVNKL